MKKIVTLFLIGISIISWAQQDAHFSNYMFSPLSYNPAVAGINNKTEFAAIHRSQWMGYQSSFDGGGAPQTQLLFGSTSLPTINSGIGGVIIRDQLGALVNLQAMGNYAYRFRIKKKTILSIGMQAGIYSQTINSNLLRPIDPDDQKLIGLDGRVTQTKPDVGAGIWILNDTYYIGASLSHILKSTFDFGSNQANTLQKHYYFTGGYTYEVDFDMRIQFSGIVKTNLDRSSFDVSAIGYYKNIMWGGLSFRQSEALIGLVGFSFLENNALKIGYSMDFVIKDRVAKTATSHEFVLLYEMPVNASFRKPIRTPRFRY